MFTACFAITTQSNYRVSLIWLKFAKNFTLHFTPNVMSKMETEGSNSVFETIADAVIYGNLGLFVGAGLPMAVLNKPGITQALSWPQLLHQCAADLKITKGEYDGIISPGTSFPHVATNLCKLIALKRNISYPTAVKELKQQISDITSLYPDTNSRGVYRNFFDILNPNWIITTNYDTVIESILTGKGHSLSPSDQLIAPKGQIPVYHLHGLRTIPDSIVITQEDYVALFRPNEYRQQKLTLLIKESVTVLIGYNLSDFNVLTAVDWSKNVFDGKSESYPNGIIQLYFTSNPKPAPYRDDNGIWIFEFSNLVELLSNLIVTVSKRCGMNAIVKNSTKNLSAEYSDPSDEMIKSFVDDPEYRAKVLNILKQHESELIDAFLELLTRSLDSVWKKAIKKGGFPIYDQYLEIILEIIESVDIKNAPPALIHLLSSSLDKVGYYIGPNYGEANAAYKTWMKQGKKINQTFIKELKNISRLSGYANLQKLILWMEKE
jgi:hypothetical protein